MENNYRRKRNANFTPSEEEILKDLIKKYCHIIEDKETNALVWKKKHLAWEKIGKEFAMMSGAKRDMKNLKDKYENIKKKDKKLAREQKEISFSGGRSNMSWATSSPERKPSFELDNSVENDTLLSNYNDDESISAKTYYVKENEVCDDSGELTLEENKNLEETITEEGIILSTLPLKSNTKKKSQYSLDQSIRKAKVELLKKQCTLIDNEEIMAQKRHAWEKEQAEIKLKILITELQILQKQLESS